MEELKSVKYKSKFSPWEVRSIQEAIEDFRDYLIVYFCDTTWEPSEILTTTVNNLDYELENEIKVIKYNIVVSYIPMELSIPIIPTSVFFKDCKEIDRLEGIHTEELVKNMIEKHVKEIK